MTPIQLRELLAIDIQVKPVVDLGGGRRYVPLDGGTFEGRGQMHGINGTVLGGGVDWQHVRHDGVIEIEAHYGLATSAGDSIEVRSTGLRKIADAVAARMANGEPVSADEYYFRTHIRLATSAPALVRLNDVIAVSTGERRRDAVRIDVHEIL